MSRERQEIEMLIKIALDERLVKRAQEITGIESKDEAVQEALRALISIREQAESGNPESETRPQDVVVQSLDRSLDENGDIWSELAKH
jgi:Arc/MetJ family transcription regulator